MSARPAFPWKAGSLRIALGAIAFSLFGCLTGTGTDTDNGLSGPTDVVARVTDSRGLPLANISIEVHTPGYRPDSAEQNPLIFFSAVTDNQGYLRMRVRKPGTYVALGRNGDAPVFLDTLHVTARGDSAFFMTHATQPFQGTVRLASNYAVDSGYVFVRGTSLKAVLGAGGTYNLGNLPATAGSVAFGVRYASHPLAMRFIRVVDLGAGGTKVFTSTGSDGACLSSPGQATPSSYVVEGSAHNDTLLASLAKTACGAYEGSSVRMQLSNNAGTVLGSLGDFTVIRRISNSTGVPAALPDAVPGSCVKSSDAASYATSLNAETGDIQVGNLSSAGSCAE